MYYYKHLNNGEVSSLESRSVEAVNPPASMVSIGKTEYDAIMTELLAAAPPEEDELADAIAALNALGYTEGSNG